MQLLSRLTILCCTLAVLGGCASMNREEKGTLIGAGGGALIGAVASGGVLLPVVGAVGGGYVGDKLSERNR
jgi:uncharacterized protein YcfJ